VVTVIAAVRTFAAKLVKCEPAGLYGLLRPMPFSRNAQGHCVTFEPKFRQTTGAGGTERGGAPNAAAVLGCRGAPLGAQA
jgi:hypothetical protein